MIKRHRRISDAGIALSNPSAYRKSMRIYSTYQLAHRSLVPVIERVRRLARGPAMPVRGDFHRFSFHQFVSGQPALYEEAKDMALIRATSPAVTWVVTPRCAIRSSTSLKLSENRWYNQTAALIASGGKRWRQFLLAGFMRLHCHTLG